MASFSLQSDYQPRGDQPRAIDELTAGIARGDRHQVLLGVTGSGKTFTMANVIAAVDRPALVLAPNKTLAAQLYGEFKELFPRQRRGVFRLLLRLLPAGSLPPHHRHLHREGFLHQRRDRQDAPLRHPQPAVPGATCSSSPRSPASTASARRRPTRPCTSSCIEGMTIGRDDLLRKLVEIQYERNDIDFHRGTFRVRGDMVEIFPAYEDEARPPHRVLRRRGRGDLRDRPPARAGSSAACRQCAIYPASHYVATRATLERAVEQIRDELEERIQLLPRAEHRWSRPSASSSAPSSTSR